LITDYPENGPDQPDCSKRILAPSYSSGYWAEGRCA
jgi:hypothetical protein